MTHPDLGTLAFGLFFAAFGLLALTRTKQMNDVQIALAKLGPWPPKKIPGLLSTRLVGGFFLALGLTLAVFVLATGEAV